MLVRLTEKSDSGVFFLDLVGDTKNGDDGCKGRGYALAVNGNDLVQVWLVFHGQRHYLALLLELAVNVGWQPSRLPTACACHALPISLNFALISLFFLSLSVVFGFGFE